MSSAHTNSITAVFFAVSLYLSLIVLFHVYSLAFPFGSSFDDAWNLHHLAAVHDYASALEFVFGGISGPLGRPLAFATFLPRAASWPSTPEDFLYENALFHLLNTVLLTWLAYRLARHLPWPISSPHWFALSVGLWWASSPLLLSASVMIIQRMTSLSAMFCLLGCIGYLIGREQLSVSPRRAFLLMSSSIVIGTVLATLCKENGALLPGYVLILEASLLASKLNGARIPSWFEAWKSLFLYLPMLALVAYLAVRLPAFIAGYESREFTFGQRLLTESRILLQYAKLLLLPVQSALGPYHDDYPLSFNLFDPPTTALAVVTLIGSLILAWRWRRNSLRLFSFAIAWFLWGHLTESTVVPLELYFEHRNYLPAAGPVIALAAVLFHPRVGSAIRAVALALVLCSSVFILRESALLWGDRRVAAQIWYQHHPASLRSLQLVLNTLQEEGLTDEYVTMVETVPPPLGNTSELAITRIVAYCGARDPRELSVAVVAATERLRISPSSSSVTELLDRLADAVGESQCPGLNQSDIKALLSAVLANESPRTRPDTHAQAHEIYARLLIRDGDPGGAIDHLEAAFRLRPTLDTGIAMASLLTALGRFDEAERKLDELAPIEPRRPYVRKRWLGAILEMREIIRNERQGHLGE